MNAVLDVAVIVVCAITVATVARLLGVAIAELRQLRREARYDAGHEPSDREVDRAFRALVRRLDDPEGR